MLSLLTLTLVLSVTLAPAQGQKYRPYYQDLLPGSYCASRPGSRQGNCCPSRIDSCSVPIRDTLCYCDQFCDRGASGDCCPDYFTFCLGEPEPIKLGCTFNGRKLIPGQDVQDNCNTCKCMQLSDAKAELMCDTSKCLVQPDLIEDINAQRYYGWTASNYSQFWGKKMASGLQYLLGTRFPNDMMNTMYPITKIYDPSLLPRSFDARDKPEWAGKIGPVVDQGWCGSSWAVSTSTTAADRLAIQGGRGERSELSRQNVLDCASAPGEDGCLGGNLDRAWNYLRTYGVAEEGCYGYESDRTSTKGQCKMPRRSRQPFSLTCSNGTTVELRRHQLKGTQPPYRIASREQDIMHELYYSGPVQAIMKVHEDFFSYRSGVYRSTGLRPSLRTAYHSVRILGWGEEVDVRGENVRYWIVANSWGQQWGENGLFRIVRGQNEADIETFVVGSWAKPSRRSRGRYRNYRRSRRHHGKHHHHKTDDQ